jgi:hypothetical protein
LREASCHTFGSGHFCDAVQKLKKGSGGDGKLLKVSHSSAGFVGDSDACRTTGAGGVIRSMHPAGMHGA